MFKMYFILYILYKIILNVNQLAKHVFCYITIDMRNHNRNNFQGI